MIIATRGNVADVMNNTTFGAPLSTHLKGLGASDLVRSIDASESLVLVGYSGIGEGNGSFIVSKGAAEATVSVVDGGVVGPHTASPLGQAVSTDELEDGAVTATKLAAGTILGSNIAAGTVTGANLANGTISGANIADGAVTTNAIAAGAVGAAQISNGSVGTSQLAEGAVTSSILAASSVTTSQISDGAVSNIKLANPSVSGAKLFPIRSIRVKCASSECGPALGDICDVAGGGGSIPIALTCAAPKTYADSTTSACGNAVCGYPTGFNRSQTLGQFCLYSSTAASDAIVFCMYQ